MTRAEFIKYWADNSHICASRIREWGLAFEAGDNRIAIPCHCEEDGCEGWQMLPASPSLLAFEVWRSEADDYVPDWIKQNPEYSAARAKFG